MLKFLYALSNILEKALIKLSTTIDKKEIKKGIKAECQDFPNYFVYSDGRIYNRKSHFFITQTKTQRGYMMVTLFKENDTKKYPRLVHSLVAKTFLENPLNYPNVAHKNGDFTDNRKSNLFFCNQIMNIHNAIQNGDNHRNGMQNHNNVLPRIIVDDIRKALENGVSQKVIAKNYGISQANVSDIKNNNIWKS